MAVRRLTWTASGVLNFTDARAAGDARRRNACRPGRREHPAGVLTLSVEATDTTGNRAAPSRGW
jgi:hypothetical protein